VFLLNCSSIVLLFVMDACTACIFDLIFAYFLLFYFSDVYCVILPSRLVSNKDVTYIIAARKTKQPGRDVYTMTCLRLNHHLNALAVHCASA